jgi:hypothetical protein
MIVSVQSEQIVIFLKLFVVYSAVVFTLFHSNYGNSNKINICCYDYFIKIINVIKKYEFLVK